MKPRSAFPASLTSGRIWNGLILIALLLCLVGGAQAGQVIPPPPKEYFNDYSATINRGTAQQLNRELEEFEKSTSNQIVVAIFPTMQTDTSIEDYAQQIFTAWKPGLKNLNNGALLLVFMKEHKIRIQTGYGLEGALPDAICKRIIDDEIAPRFRTGDYNGGMIAAVQSMIQATKGEYKGSGRTVAQNRGRGDSSLSSWLPPLLFFGLFIFIATRARKTGTYYYGGGSSSSWGSGWGGGGGWSSGGGGDSGGFSGGGGDSGGGGASGSW